MTSELGIPMPNEPLQCVVRADDVFPVPKTRNPKNLVPGPWMPGDVMPARDGRYLRYFDDVDDCAWSQFVDGEWTRDGFWPSDMQNAPWRGGVRPNPAGEPEMNP